MYKEFDRPWCLRRIQDCEAEVVNYTSRENFFNATFILARGYLTRLR